MKAPKLFALSAAALAMGGVGLPALGSPVSEIVSKKSVASSDTSKQIGIRPPMTSPKPIDSGAAAPGVVRAAAPKVAPAPVAAPRAEPIKSVPIKIAPAPKAEPVKPAPVKLAPAPAPKATPVKAATAEAPRPMKKVEAPVMKKLEPAPKVAPVADAPRKVEPRKPVQPAPAKRPL